ncbi:SLBB domain-containing protein [Prevotella sp. A2931]|uniref:SLBB domain-containing protein n=1 Tax=Prevotella illustrans TaxID=2800387 RepID=A0ABS3M4A7_9BACT|nr:MULTISPECIES: SLBB domain-containing protein [Prevotella]MBO1362992.1 SLBB domain-containing protein [Prevotella illustrans]PTL25512.1 capsule biosynthesis protein [Prevotella sp. oral taxon 820]
MKKAVLILAISILSSLSLSAQSTMTDEQVMATITREHAAGKSQAQIVTKLMQSGVDINQIRRVKKRYERLKDNKGLGMLADKNGNQADNRLRQNNGESKQQAAKQKTTTDMQITAMQESDLDKRQGDMKNELNGILPTDSAQLSAERNRENQVFGRDIFNNKQLSFEPNMNIATPQNYRLGPGDAVIIDIYGASQKTIDATVSPDGDITVEGFGPVQVSGLTVAQANARLRSTLGARYSSSKVRLTVGQTKTITINVMGEVKTPGTYTLSAFATVFQALYMAGGTNDLGTLRNIKVYRNNRLVTVVDIYDYILNGKMSGNIRLADGDVIIIGPYDSLVKIEGKVKRPMFYEMKKSESLASLLKYAGDFMGNAYRKSIRVKRKNGREYSVFNVDEFDFGNFRIADGDSVTVDSILPRYKNTVEIKGAVFRPGLYNIGSRINTVRSLIEHAEGVTENAFTAHAVMHRMKEDRTLRVIPIDVAGILNGTAADMPLRENDVLFIPTRSDMMQERTITIHGEVHYPGIYRYADDETIEDIVLQAGGLKDAASTIKVDVARRISNPKAVKNDSIIARTYSFSLKDGFVIDGEQGFKLMPYDEVYVRRSPGYSTQRNITIEGQAMFAGVYTLSSKNERLSDVIRKAGGLTDLAYVKGARLIRRTSADEQGRIQTVTRLLEAQVGQKDSLNAAMLQLSTSYPVGIELDKAMAHPGSDYDVVLREGDRVIIPEYTGTVKISGDVMYPNTITYTKGKRPDWYIDQAGGWGNRAKKSRTFIIYMNGTVARVSHNAKVQPGCEIVVPSKPKSNGNTLGQWLGIGSSVASIAAMIATIANLTK